MEKKSRNVEGGLPRRAEERELEAKKKLARPPKDKREVIIGPTDRTGPDVVVE